MVFRSPVRMIAAFGLSLWACWMYCSRIWIYFNLVSYSFKLAFRWVEKTNNRCLVTLCSSSTKTN